MMGIARIFLWGGQGGSLLWRLFSRTGTRRNWTLFAIFIAGCATAQTLQSPLQADLADRNLRTIKQSHCEADEVAVFTCGIGKKIASICASKIIDESHGYLQYRFGMKKKIELAIPSKQTYTPSMVGYMYATCASCYANYVRFTNGNYRYYIFNASIRVKDDPQTGASQRDEPSGVVVMKNDKVIYSRRCTTPVFEHNVGEHFLGKAAINLDAQDDVNPFDLAFP